MFLAKCLSDIELEYSRWRLRAWFRANLADFHPAKDLMSKKQIREVQDFYKPYFKLHIKFIKFYTEKTGKFYVNYLPDDYYYTRIDQYYNDWSKADEMDDKCYYDRLLSTIGIKRPKTLCYRINGLWLDAEYRPITPEQVKRIVMNANQAFIKQSVDSCGGKGIIFFNKGKDGQHIDEIINKLDKDVIIQEPVKQSKALSKINESSLNTIRILSFLNSDGSVKIYSSVLRMGINGSKVDNASSGGITCGILPDGRLKNVAFTAKGEKFDCHPNSGAIFSDTTIPGYSEICEIIKKSHPQLPNFRLLSWDIAIDEKDEPVLIEINLKSGELDFHQLNNGPLFGEDTKQILDEVFGKK